MTKKVIKKKVYARKPPIGLRPRFVVESERLQEISEAVNRYVKAGFDVPEEWLDEWEEIAKKYPELIGDEE